MNIPIIVKGRYKEVPAPSRIPDKDRAIPPGLSEVDADDLSYEELARLHSRYISSAPPLSCIYSRSSLVVMPIYVLLQQNAAASLASVGLVSNNRFSWMATMSSGEDKLQSYHETEPA